MTEYRTCEEKEHRSAIELSKSVFKENMEEQFPLLLGKTNLERMFVCVKDKEVVSLVNYYPAHVKLNESHITVGSIGSVCTHQNFRGQKMASTLLILAENQMLKEQIRIAIISGEGGIYHKMGATVVGDVDAFILNKSSVEAFSHYSLLEYQEKYLKELLSIYNQETIRFVRSESEFSLLILGQTYPDTFATYPNLLIFENETLVAYIIFEMKNNLKSLLVKEYGGSRQAIVETIPLILKKYNKNKLTILATPEDEIHEMLKKHKVHKTDQHASFKIIDFLGLISDLKPYFLSKFDEEFLNQIKIKIEETKYVFTFENEKFIINDIHELNKLIFGPNKNIIKQVSSFTLKLFLKEVFPIPFVWTHNLNYQ
ncbi:MAG: GNAT family N-acetyltransferase [Firmicutes bacterium]|nr:GNAT family N-acetyltransferase [Bacillota bacterium]